MFFFRILRIWGIFRKIISIFFTIFFTKMARQILFICISPGNKFGEKMVKKSSRRVDHEQSGTKFVKKYFPSGQQKKKKVKKKEKKIR